MITLATSLCVVILAIVNAFFSQQVSDWVLPQDRKLYFPPFLKSEGFCRSCLINLSFAGISMAAASIHAIKYTTFWVLRDPLLAIFLNLGLGLFVAIAMVSKSTPDEDGKRTRWVLAFLLAGLCSFAFSVWTAVGVATGGTDGNS